MTVAINAQTLFDRSARIQRAPDQTDDEQDRLTFYEKISNIHAINLVLKNAFDVPVNASTRASFTQTLLVQRRGPSGGNIAFGLNHRLNSKVNLHTSAQLLRPHNISFKATYQPDTQSFAEVQTAVRTFNMPPPLVIGLGHQVTKTITGFITMKSGFYQLGSWGHGASLRARQPPSLTIGLNGHPGWGATIDTSVRSSQLHLNYTTRVLDKTVRLKFGTAISNTGQVSVTCGADRKTILETNLGLTLLFSANGVNMRIK